MSGVPIIPMGINAKKNYRPFSKVVINIGKPIDLNEYKDKRSDKKTLDNLSKELMEEMIRLTNTEI